MFAILDLPSRMQVLIIYHYGIKKGIGGGAGAVDIKSVYAPSSVFFIGFVLGKVFNIILIIY